LAVAAAAARPLLAAKAAASRTATAAITISLTQLGRFIKEQ
jgi:hypothetical protein